MDQIGVTGASSYSDLDVCLGVGWMTGLGSCAFDYGCGIGGGGGGVVMWAIALVNSQVARIPLVTTNVNI